MKKTQVKKGGLMFAAGALALTAQAKATFNAFPYLETMGGDTDAYTPADGGAFDQDPVNDPSLAVAPPADWGDVRGGNPNGSGSGVYEELPDGYHGINTGDGSGHFAIVQSRTGAYGYGYGDATFGRPGYGGPAYPNPQSNGGLISAQVDVWINPDSLPSTQSVMDWDVAPANSYGYYVSEARLSMIPQLGGTWNIQIAGGPVIANVATGQWVTLEVQPVDGGADVLYFEYNVWDVGHTTLLGSQTMVNYLGGAALFSQVEGPRYNWWTLSGPVYGDSRIYVDNEGWSNPIEIGDRTLEAPASDPALEEVPEPATLTLVGLAGILLAGRRSKKA